MFATLFAWLYAWTGRSQPDCIIPPPYEED